MLLGYNVNCFLRYRRSSPSSLLPVAEITAQVDFDIPENIEMFTINLVLLGQKAPGRQCVVTASTMDGTAVSTGKIFFLQRAGFYPVGGEASPQTFQLKDLVNDFFLIAPNCPNALTFFL